MQQLTATDPRVVSFYNFISNKPKNSDGYYIGSKQNAAGLLYVISGDRPMIQVWLPIELLEYANAAAGTSGNRAVGIRVAGFSSVKKAAEEILRIFSSPESLARFINSSECDFTGVTGRPVRETEVLITLGPWARDEKKGFWSRYNKNDLQFLTAKFGKDLVSRAYSTLTLPEFEQLFGIEE